MTKNIAIKRFVANEMKGNEEEKIYSLVYHSKYSHVVLYEHSHSFSLSLQMLIIIIVLQVVYKDEEKHVDRM